jgi:hypothetical protein
LEGGEGDEEENNNNNYQLSLEVSKAETPSNSISSLIAKLIHS